MLTARQYVYEQFLLTARERQFSYGLHDCCVFAADCVYALTGIDPAKGLRGSYQDQFEAAAVIKSHGGTLESLFDRCLSGIAFEIDPSRVARADIIVAEIPVSGYPQPKKTGGICHGAHLLFPARRGLIEHQLGTVPIVKAWRLHLEPCHKQ